VKEAGQRELHGARGTARFGLRFVNLDVQSRLSKSDAGCEPIRSAPDDDCVSDHTHIVAC
jgi:hypothetical protein